MLSSIRRHPGWCYFPALAVVFAAFVFAWGMDLLRHTRALEVVLPLLALSSLPLSEMAIASVNAFVLALLPPRVLQKLSFRDGIPVEHRTLVVVPSLIDGAATLTELLSRL